MMMQLNPPLPVITPKGPALAHFLIDDGIEHDLKWVCFQDSNGECWTFSNRYIRAQKNVTQGREYISPFYDPDDVAIPKKEFEAPCDGIYNFTCEHSLMTEEEEDGEKEIQPETGDSESCSGGCGVCDFKDDVRSDIQMTDKPYQNGGN